MIKTNGMNRPSLTMRTIKDGINHKYKVIKCYLYEWSVKMIIDNKDFYRVKQISKDNFMMRFVEN